LFFTDVHFKPAFKPYSFNGRIQYVETSGYNSRIYAWENTLLYNFSIPAFFDQAFRYAVNVNYRLMNHRQRNTRFNCLISVFLAQSVNPFKTTVGTANMAVQQAARSEIKLQIIFATR